MSTCTKTKRFSKRFHLVLTLSFIFFGFSKAYSHTLEEIESLLRQFPNRLQQVSTRSLESAVYQNSNRQFLKDLLQLDIQPLDNEGPALWNRVHWIATNELLKRIARHEAGIYFEKFKKLLNEEWSRVWKDSSDSVLSIFERRPDIFDSILIDELTKDSPSNILKTIPDLSERFQADPRWQSILKNLSEHGTFRRKLLNDLLVAPDNAKLGPWSGAFQLDRVGAAAALRFLSYGQARTLLLTQLNEESQSEEEHAERSKLVSELFDSMIAGQTELKPEDEVRACRELLELGIALQKFAAFIKKPRPAALPNSQPN